MEIAETLNKDSASAKKASSLTANPVHMELLAHPDRFAQRHIGPSADETRQMLEALGFASLEALVDEAVPGQIRLNRPLALPAAKSEFETLAALKEIASQNQVFRSYIGMGYYDCITPAVIRRNILENPGWYTPYTPYQAELAQGRLEALLNFQTMVTELTGMEIANASLLDEATATAEAMHMMESFKTPSPSGQERHAVLLDPGCHPQTVEVLRTRALA